ncbi:MAG: DNA gyrase subunit A, partial [Nitrospirae bacterium]
LIGAEITDGQRDILLGTRRGIVIRFPETEVRPMGRTAYGVRGIALDEGNEVIGMETITADSTTSVLTVTERGYGKRTPVTEYRVQGRGGRGIISVKVTDKTGPAVGFLQVKETDDVMIMTAEGKVLRIKMQDVREVGRNAQGVRLIDIDEQDRVVGIAKLVESDDLDSPNVEGNGAHTPQNA